MQYSRNGGFGGLRPSFIRAQDAPTSHITLDEVKRHLGIFSTEFDAELTAIANAASEYANNILGETVADTTYVAYYAGADQRLLMGHKFVTSLAGVTYYDTTNTLTVLVEGTDFVLDQTSEYPSIVIMTPNIATSSDFENPVEIQYISGLSDAYFTDKIRQATLLVAGDMFENKVPTSNTSYSIRAADRLLSPLKKVLV